MSYVRIAHITTTSAAGKSCRFELYELDGTAADEKFPVEGYKLTFNLSDGGFGILNQALSLNIVDEDDDTYYNRFKNIDNKKYGVRVLLSSDDFTDKQIFWGFPDFQFLKRQEFELGKKILSVRFFTPLQFKNENRYNVSEIQTLIPKGQGTQAPSQLVRIGAMLQSIVFNEYFENSYEFSSKIEPTVARGSGFPSTVDYAFFNEAYYHQNVALNLLPNISVAGWFNLVLRSFFMRAGYSFTAGMPSIQSVHNGRRNGVRISAIVEAEEISIDSGRLILNKCTRTDGVALPVISKNKIALGVDRSDISPFFSVTYTREGVKDTDPSFPNNDVTRTEINPNGISPLVFNAYQGVNIPFDPYQTSNANILFLGVARSPSAGSSFISRLANARDVDYHPTIGQDLTFYNARSHLQIRTDVESELVFSYDGILDPMLNHLTDFDDNAYVFIRGEYDLINQRTIVSRSTSLFRTQT